MSQISEFYAGQTLFITGGTGFLGNVLIEKLLRTCPNIKQIYVLIRTKNDILPQKRLMNIFDNPLFELLKSSNHSCLTKVVAVEGDFMQPFLGLSLKDQTLLKKEVTCVFNVAANVRFDADLKTAVYSNVRSLFDLLEIAKDMKNLRVFVDVSTAFSHCGKDKVEERFYDVNIEPKRLVKLVELMDDNLINAVTPAILDKWPNTYVYTKAVAEEVIRSCKHDLSIVICRPGIVTGTFEDPIPGWVSGIQGVSGIVIGSALGIVRTIHVKNDLAAKIVPVDYVVNNIIAIPWDVDNNENTKSIKIYNMVGSNDNTITWKEFISALAKLAPVYPVSAAIWHTFFSPSENRMVFKLKIFFFHTVFAYFADAMLIMFSQKPIAVKKYQKINKLLGLFTFATTNSWNFDTTNVMNLWNKLHETDKKMYKFDMSTFDFKEYITRNVQGGRLYLLNDHPDKLPAARRKYYVLCAVHYGFCLFLFYSIFKWFILPIVNCFL